MGETISPTIVARPWTSPSTDLRFTEAEAGTISATGTPYLVIRTGRLVLLTVLTTFRQLARNLEMPICFTSPSYHCAIKVYCDEVDAPTSSASYAPSRNTVTFARCPLASLASAVYKRASSFSASAM